MRRAHFLLSFLVLLAALPPARADDLAQLRAIKSIPETTWQAVADGAEPWPEALFPLSYWPEKDRKKLPQEFWERLAAHERKWPEFIKTQRELYRREYGPAVKNAYDLFLEEQAEMKQPDYQKASPPVLKKKTLKRLTDLAYLPGRAFGGLAGAGLESIRVFAFRQGKLRVIPFDIVEFTDESRVVLPQGPEGNPEEGDGIFRNNDLLFFMVHDAGHRIAKESVGRAFPGASAVREVEISCSPEGETGWVYAASFAADPPAKSPFNYIEFYPEFNVTFTPVSFNQCHPRKIKKEIHPTLKTGTWLSSPAVGGRPYDIHDHLRIRVSLKYLVGSTFDDEDNLTVRWRAWFEGQVVNYNRAAWKLTTPLGIGAPTVFNDIVANAFSVFNYITWYSPFNPSVFVKHLDVKVGEQLNDRVARQRDELTVRFLSEHNRKGCAADGKMSDRDAALDDRFSSWHLFTGPHGTVCMRNDYDDFLTEKGTRTLDWRDDEKNPGNFDTHLVIKDLSNRSEHFYVDWNAVPFFWNEDPGKYRWDSLDLVLKRLDRPLTFSVEGTPALTTGVYIHVPDVHAEEKHYDL